MGSLGYILTRNLGLWIWVTKSMLGLFLSFCCLLGRHDIRVHSPCIITIYITKEISFISAYAWGHSNFQLRKCFLTQNSKMMKSLFQAHDIRETDISMMQNPAYSCSISLNFIYSRYFTLLTLEVNACWNCLGNRFKVCPETILEFYIQT